MPGLVPVSKDKEKAGFCEGSRDFGAEAPKATGAAALPYFPVDTVQGSHRSSETRLPDASSSDCMLGHILNPN